MGEVFMRLHLSQRSEQAVTVTTPVMVIVRRMGRLAGLSREDEVSLLFCGSQKSLASGVPIANILFAGGATGLIILPLMLYHQFQLFFCAAIAQHYAAADDVRQSLVQSEA